MENSNTAADAAWLAGLEDSIARAIRERPGKRMFAMQHHGHKLWVKQAEQVYHVPWLKFARWACCHLPLKLLQPGADTDGKKALRLEGGRLRRLKKRDLPVPELYAATSDYLAIADGGRPLLDCLDDEDIAIEAKTQLLRQAAAALAALHRAGLHHGRPALKDMVWDGEKLLLIDFEDGFVLKLSRKERLARDVLLFMQSIFKECGATAPVLAAAAWETYRQQVPETAASCCEVFLQFRWLKTLLNLGLRHCGSDLESTCALLEFLLQADDSAAPYCN